MLPCYDVYHASRFHPKAWGSSHGPGRFTGFLVMVAIAEVKGLPFKEGVRSPENLVESWFLQISEKPEARHDFFLKVK